MPIQETKYIWRNGEMIPWAEATTHVLTHALHYGTSVFEGMRSYETKHKGVCVFRNREHVERLIYSARVYRIAIDHSVEDLMQACRDIIRENRTWLRLYPAGGVSGLWRNGTIVSKRPLRTMHRCFSVGRIPWGRRDAQRSQSVRIKLAANGAGHRTGGRQSWRQLPVEPLSQYGSKTKWLRGRNRTFT